jgi:hypothetical protein
MTDEKDDRAPDSVNRSSEAAIPGDIGHLGPEIHKTELEKGSATYTGHGWTQEEADKNAGDRYRDGVKDKK